MITLYLTETITGARGDRFYATAQENHPPTMDGGPGADAGIYIETPYCDSPEAAMSKLKSVLNMNAVELVPVDEHDGDNGQP